MIKSICFVCTGNICRSPMAEFIFKEMLHQHGLEREYLIESRATTTEEIGNPPHYGTVLKLAQFGIVPANKFAEQLKKSEYKKYDLIIGMDSMNIRGIMRIVGGDPDNKVKKLLSFAGAEADIADPWYTNDFDTAYNDIKKGCDGLAEYLGIAGKI